MCSVAGCNNPVHAKGMCNQHYRRWLKYNDPLFITRRAPAAPGEPLRYMLAHMYDGCCYPWPYAKSRGRPEVTDDDGRMRGPDLVCEMVNGPPMEGQEVRHKCGKGHLGCFNADCLEWGSRSDNKQDSIKHGTWAHGEQHGNKVVLTDDTKRLRRMYATGNYTQKFLGKMFGIGQSQVSKIVRREQRRDG